MHQLQQRPAVLAERRAGRQWGDSTCQTRRRGKTWPRADTSGAQQDPYGRRHLHPRPSLQPRPAGAGRLSRCGCAGHRACQRW